MTRLGQEAELRTEYHMDYSEVDAIDLNAIILS